jgi:hypothetical protein
MESELPLSSMSSISGSERNDRRQNLHLDGSLYIPVTEWDGYAYAQFYGKNTCMGVWMVEKPTERDVSKCIYKKN